MATKQYDGVIWFKADKRGEAVTLFVEESSGPGVPPPDGGGGGDGPPLKPTHPIVNRPAHPIILPPDPPPIDPPVDPPTNPPSQSWVWGYSPQYGWHPVYVPGEGDKQPH